MRCLLIQSGGGGGWTPQTPVPLNLYINPDDPTGLTLSGADVTSYIERSANAAVYNGGILKPTYSVNGGPGSTGVFTFVNGAVLTDGSTVVIDPANPFTIVYVGQLTSILSGYKYFYCFAGSTPDNSAYILFSNQATYNNVSFTASGVQWASVRSGVGNPPLADGNPHKVVLTYNGMGGTNVANFEWTIDGVVIATVAGGSDGPPATSEIGLTAPFGYAGSLLATMVYGKKWDASDFAGFNAYCLSMWGF